MNSILLLTSNVFTPPGEPEEQPPGKEVADYLRKRLEDFGIRSTDPVEATEGWEFYITVQEKTYVVFVHWAPIGCPPEDFWVLQVRPRWGLLQSLFKRRSPDELPEAMFELLTQIVSIDHTFLSARWITMEEFRRIY